MPACSASCVQEWESLSLEKAHNAYLLVYELAEGGLAAPSARAELTLPLHLTDEAVRPRASARVRADRGRWARARSGEHREAERAHGEGPRALLGRVRLVPPHCLPACRLPAHELPAVASSQIRFFWNVLLSLEPHAKKDAVGATRAASSVPSSLSATQDLAVSAAHTTALVLFEVVARARVTKKLEQWTHVRSHATPLSQAIASRHLMAPAVVCALVLLAACQVALLDGSRRAGCAGVRRRQRRALPACHAAELPQRHRAVSGPAGQDSAD